MTPAEMQASLLAATKQDPQGGSEDRQRFLGRLVRATNDLSDAAWKGLDKSVQVWINDAIEDMNKKTLLKDFDGTRPESAPDRQVSATGNKDAAQQSTEDAAKHANTTSTDYPPARTQAAQDNANTTERRRVNQTADETANNTAPPAAAGQNQTAPTTTRQRIATEAKDPNKPKATDVFRGLVIANPDAQKADLIKQVEAQGLTIAKATADSTYYETTRTIKAAKAAGKWKD